MAAFRYLNFLTNLLAKNAKLVLSGMLISNLFIFEAAFAQDAESLFKEKCAGCHSIGGGNLVGPDLADTADWPAMELSKAVKRMEENTGPLKESEVDALVKYLKEAKSPSAKTSVAASTTEPGKNDSTTLARESTADLQKEIGSIAMGKRLFDGDNSLKNGGLSCIACHSIEGSGGNMGPDLTQISAKLSPQALVSACEHTPYKVMKTAYREHPITHQEALDIQAYLSSLKNESQKPKHSPVTFIASVFAFFVLGTIALAYKGRPKSARSKLTEKK